MEWTKWQTQASCVSPYKEWKVKCESRWLHIEQLNTRRMHWNAECESIECELGSPRVWRCIAREVLHHKEWVNAKCVRNWILVCQLRSRISYNHCWLLKPRFPKKRATIAEPIIPLFKLSTCKTESHLRYRLPSACESLEASTLCVELLGQLQHHFSASKNRPGRGLSLGTLPIVRRYSSPPTFRRMTEASKMVSERAPYRKKPAIGRVKMTLFCEFFWRLFLTKNPLFCVFRVINFAPPRASIAFLLSQPQKASNIFIPIFCDFSISSNLW